jgi:hypothetical protein
VIIRYAQAESKLFDDQRGSSRVDPLAYRRACAPVLDDQEGPYGLAYAWGRGLKPTTDAEVTVCTPDTLADALGAILDDTHAIAP